MVGSFLASFRSALEWALSFSIKVCARLVLLLYLSYRFVLPARLTPFRVFEVTNMLVKVTGNVLSPPGRERQYVVIFLGAFPGLRSPSALRPLLGLQPLP